MATAHLQEVLQGGKVPGTYAGVAYGVLVCASAWWGAGGGCFVILREGERNQFE